MNSQTHKIIRTTTLMTIFSIILVTLPLATAEDAWTAELVPAVPAAWLGSLLDCRRNWHQIAFCTLGERGWCPFCLHASSAHRFRSVGHWFRATLGAALGLLLSHLTQTQAVLACLQATLWAGG